MSVSRICENQRHIQSILRYWFGQYESPEMSRKKLWMISSKDALHRRTVDAQIATQFGSLLLDLVGDRCAIDSSSSSPPLPSRLTEWCDETTTTTDFTKTTSEQNNNMIYGYQGKLAAIIVLDQFSRHVHRFLLEQQKAVVETTPTIGDHPTLPGHVLLLFQSLPDQSTVDAMAYQTAVLLKQRHAVELNTNVIPTAMAIFALLPYRHRSTLESMQYTQQQTLQLATMATAAHQSDTRLIQRFRQATNRRFSDLLDETARQAGSGSNGCHSIQSSSTKGDDKATKTEISSLTYYDDATILEHFPFTADLATASNHIVHQTIRHFLAKFGILPDPHATTGTTTATTTMATRRIKRPIVISLSGGVDSMVIAAVLAHLKEHCGYPDLHIVAVHIDYANRPESAAEAAYVQRYCHDHAIEFHCRRIDEVTRGITARDRYERIAREIRYTFYKETVSACLNYLDITQTASTATAAALKASQVGVLLGHHRGDLRENVLSNAHKGCGPLDLSGMTASSCNDGVTLYRPLLPLEKLAILDYAHTFGVPYFKDTTPHWSTRGKLRNKLLPLLEEIYGEGSMNNLSNLAVESDECRALLRSVMIQPFMDRIVYQPMGITFPTAPWKEQGPFFWKFVLREALHSAGLGMFTDKSVESFMKRACIATNIIREGWLQCRKDVAVYLRGDGQVFVLYPTSFPWNKKDYYDCAGLTVAYGPENSAQIGPWRVTAELCSGENSQLSPDHIKLALEQKAFSSMETFMKGNYEYYLQVPTWKNGKDEFVPRPLVFTKFLKRFRPRAWKNIDPKIQDTLPLLGNNEASIKALDDPVGCGAVHTDHENNISATPVLCAKISLRLGDSAPTS